MIDQEEILKMARQAGCFEKHQVLYFTSPELEAFAKLVADIATAKERERVTFEVVNEAQLAVQEAIAKEREACAKECEQTALRMGSEWMAQHCANAIRARGETTLRGEAT